MPKIDPTVGRVVWFWPVGAFARAEQPRAATIAHVHSPTLINIGYLSESGSHRYETSVYLWHGDSLDEPRPDHAHCEWMPYQKGQAAKTEALERTIETGENLNGRPRGS